MRKSIQRKTNETNVQASLAINGEQRIDIKTPLNFLNHMLEQLAFHACWDLTITASGDIDVDDHHLIEDIAISLGRIFKDNWRALDKIERYGSFLLPMDEALVISAIDISGRPYSVIDLPFSREFTGGIATEMWQHFFYTFAINAEITLHIKTQYFTNNHHLVEAAFKSVGRSLKIATEASSYSNTTKGIL